MSWIKRGSAVLLACLCGATFLGGTARASCGLAPPVPQAIAEAPAAFVGTVSELSNGRRWATVTVDEVWKGEDIPDEVEVRAGPKDPPGGGGVATSADRYFEPTQQYLFVPYKRAGSVFRDNACTRTSPFRPSLERHRPSGSETPETPDEGAETPSGSASDETGEPDENGSDWLLPAGIAIVAALAGAGLFLRRRSA